MSENQPVVPSLSSIERRVLGVLVEKAYTTDSYPLTANSTVSGCNQKSNRDPVTNYQPHEIDSCLIDLKGAGLVIERFSDGSRTARWKHNLYDAWGLDRPALAVLAELMLRGPQSEGDMRARASRMAPIESLDDLRVILAKLQERGFVRRLSPEGRKRGVMWGHLVLKERERAELDRIAEHESQRGDEEESAAVSSHGSAGSGVIAQLEARLGELEQRVARLEGNQSPSE